MDNQLNTNQVELSDRIEAVQALAVAPFVIMLVTLAVIIIGLAWMSRR